QICLEVEHRVARLREGESESEADRCLALAGGPRGQHQDTTAPSKVDESEVRGELPHRLCDPAARGGAQGSHQISLGAGCGELPEYTGVCDGSNLIGVVDPRDVVAAVQGDGDTDY